jgi:hypothetical protein
LQRWFNFAFSSVHPWAVDFTDVRHGTVGIVQALTILAQFTALEDEQAHFESVQRMSTVCG